MSFQPSVVDEVDGVTQEDLDNGSITQDEYEALVTAQEEQNGSARSPLGGAQDVVETASDPAEAAKTVWERLAQLFASGMNLLVDQVFNEALGTPTINNDGAFGIFGTPEALETGEETPANQEATVYDAVASQNYVTIHKEIFMGLIMPMAVSIMFLLALLMLAAPITALITRQQVGSMLASGVFVILIIVVSWEYAALMHALSDAAVQYVLPETDQILNQEATTFGGGVAVAIGIYFGGWSAAVMLVAIHTARHLLLFVYPAVLPLFLLMAYWGGHRRVKQIGSFFVWQWYGLLVMNLPTAILLRFADEVGWQLFPDGAAFEILNLGSTIAIFLLAVAIPLAVSGSFFLVGLSMRGATAGAATAAASRFTPTPRTAATHGGAAARSAAGRLKRGGRTAASRAHTKYRESRFPSVTQEKYATDGGTRTDGGSPSRSGTTTQSSGVSPDQRKRAAEQKQRQRNLESQRERARQERDSYRK
ncbi:hypothetical protein GWG54_18485 [Natronococcus sp. JC468]|nr:hypothetical protein [Natronococcus sp. JC468]